MSSGTTNGSLRRGRREVPGAYYHRHFLEVLEFVTAHYDHVLDEAERALAREFRALGKEAQCLYVRLANRKGRIFDARKLRYPEIGALAGPIASLRRAGWFGSPGPDLFEDLLHFLTRDTLHRQVSVFLPGLGRSLRKAELVDLARTRCEPEAFLARLEPGHLLVQRRTDWVGYLLFLYFGEVQSGLSRFTLRDLGLVRTHSFTDQYEPRFSDREEAREAWFFSTRLARLGAGDHRALSGLPDGTDDWPEPVSDAGAELRDRLVLRSGRALEKAGRIEDALGLFRRGDSPDCCERLARLLLAQGRRDEARALLEERLEDPRSQEEGFFAAELLEREFCRKRTSALTEELRSAAVIKLDEAHVGSPERAAIAHFEARGMRAYRAENGLWRTLFGLVFWDLLYAPDSAALHSPFDALPSTLRDRSFHRVHAQAVASRLAGLADRPATRRLLLLTMTRHFGTANGLFRWRRSMAESVLAFLDVADPGAVATILRAMCRDYPGTRYGFPDLLVIDEVGPRFVEIKAAGDQLRRNQIVRLRQLRDAGFRAEVLRIRWTLDPRQTYVVVDIETTGGPGDRHRVTEIAAIKMRDGEIVDRFQTLLNPQRLIPANITRLTGITDEMVADAPVFADVADAFTGFMGDAIFVAHNVSFDYGFLAREYAGIGRGFRYPKLCTCASMRRLYPGHASYSLGHLCREFDIPLTRHHRAMCDAEAAARLLIMVNEKRRERLAARGQAG